MYDGMQHNQVWLDIATSAPTHTFRYYGEKRNQRQEYDTKPIGRLF